MVHVAREMKRRRLRRAAADRRGHDQRQAHGREDRPGSTRVRSVHVLDASRSVGVVEKLMNPEARPTFDEDNRRLQAQLVESHAKRQEATLVPYADALARRFRDRLGDRRHPDARVHRPAAC